MYVRVCNKTNKKGTSIENRRTENPAKELGEYFLERLLTWPGGNTSTVNKKGYNKN